jgi:hypothetical protein
MSFGEKIQHLADTRNYYDHKKEREPTEEVAMDLIAGTDSIVKRYFEFSPAFEPYPDFRIW